MLFAKVLFLPYDRLWTNTKQLYKYINIIVQFVNGWCGWQDLNLHEVAPIRTWILRVCQFRHTRKQNIWYTNFYDLSRLYLYFRFYVAKKYVWFFCQIIVREKKVWYNNFRKTIIIGEFLYGRKENKNSRRFI